MDDSDWITRIFVSIDKRYGVELKIPYNEVEVALDEMRAHNEKMAESKTGLNQLLMYGAGDYGLKVMEIASGGNNAGNN